MKAEHIDKVKMKSLFILSFIITATGIVLSLWI